MASARNLCQHVDIDGIQCSSHNYILCPHCQLELCLKHLNTHQDFLRTDLILLSDQINCLRVNLDHLTFDSSNSRDQLFQKLDHWYENQIHSIKEIYLERKQQLETCCIQAQLEFETYKNKKQKQLKDNLIQQFQRVYRDERQIHIEDLNEIKWKLTDIERGLDELKHLLIEIHSDQSIANIQIVKRRYVEATKVVHSSIKL